MRKGVDFMCKINDLFLKRESCRSFLNKKVEEESVVKIIESARMAPSGKNRQPWRFVVVRTWNIKNQIADQSIYNKWMKTADVFIVVYMDRKSSYDKKKDNQSIGAAIENMCLQATALGLGTCWVGEILKNEKEVNSIIEVPPSYELMAVVCLGYIKERKERPQRLSLNELVYKSI